MSVGLTQRKKGGTEVVDDEATSSSDNPPSHQSSTDDLKGMQKPSTVPRKSLKERSQIPYSMYVIYGTIFALEFYGGVYRVETLQSWWRSMATSASTCVALLGYTRDLTKTAVDGEYQDWQEYAQTGVIFSLVLSLLYVFFVAPFRAGLWTGTKARRHKIHRYMGLMYLVQYTFAWVEYFTDYDNAAKSFLPHFIALNGIIQGTSAYFSFKVLPDLIDAGYYSDKAVLSRNFVHENLFFSLMSVWGSIYYNTPVRSIMQTHLGGKLVEGIYLFFPYILVRTWFPVTRFSNTGTTYKGRSESNKRFYEIGTFTVKIFFLWAKYFCGFFINWLVYLDLVTTEQWKFLHGLFLLNLGTVSLAVFLHTLRFKKVLPAKFTFSLYLVQIYLTFTAIPLAYDMFASHPNLCALCASGILCNMTRSRKIHGLWCLASLYLLTQTDISW